jgi:hypothetical protein
LKVTVKNAEKLTLQSRRGYFAPKHVADASQEAKEEIAPVSAFLFISFGLRQYPEGHVPQNGTAGLSTWTSPVAVLGGVVTAISELATTKATAPLKLTLVSARMSPAC